MTIEQQIKKPKSNVFRRCFIKRRLLATGLFETDWLEITNDVKKWGTITTKVDVTRNSRFKFPSMKIKVENSSGRYNHEDSVLSLWNGYASQQRTLLKIEAGFTHYTQASSGIWSSTEFPSNTTQFVGLVSGDMMAQDNEEISLNVTSLDKLFLNFPAKSINGYTSTGLTASDFCGLLRDQTDGAGAFVFRPFFGDTTTNWLITTTTTNYPGLDTITSKDIRNKNCWQILEKLAEAETFAPRINKSGQFVFGSQAVGASSTFSFFGPNSYDGTYGVTIKKIKSFGQKISNFYSGVSLKFIDADTYTSFSDTQSALTVNGTNPAWNYGHRSYDFENTMIQSTATANTIVQNLFNDFSAVKNEIKFETSFVPHLNPLDKINMTWETSAFGGSNKWDQNDWDTELIWDAETSTSIDLNNAEFKSLSIELNLDNMSTVFTARET